MNALSADHLPFLHAAAAKTVFFLHVPRTAGRTYHACFLKLATPPSHRCEKSYDILRLNASIPTCGLLGSHDDLSVMQYLPTETAVVTQLRFAFLLYFAFTQVVLVVYLSKLNCCSTCSIFCSIMPS